MSNEEKERMVSGFEYDCARAPLAEMYIDDTRRMNESKHMPSHISMSTWATLHRTQSE